MRRPPRGRRFFIHHQKPTITNASDFVNPGLSALDDYCDPLPEFIYHLKGKVEEERFQSLMEEAEREEQEDRTLDFMISYEQHAIENVFALQELEGHIENGIFGLAHYEVRSGKIQITVRSRHRGRRAYFSEFLTPYDYRDGRFQDLSKNCVTKEWW